MRILSVDDDPIFLEIIRAELARLGYADVHQVSSGSDAIDLVRTAKDDFDCCLLDIDMPGMNGVDLCRHLRDEPRTQDVPIIMVTSRAELENVDRAFSAGATDYLNKPLNPRELRGRLTMVEGLAQEKAKRAAGTYSGDEWPVRIDDPLRLDPSAGCIDYIAMQNYMLKLGSFEAFNRAITGVHVSNIHQIHLTKDANGFRDTLCDVAEILVDALGSQPKVMSYAGSGDFVIVQNRIPAIEQENLIDSLTLSLDMLTEWYGSFGEIAPTLRIGEPISRSLLSFIAPDELLEKAIERARKSEIEVGSNPLQSPKTPVGHRHVAS